MAKRKKKDEMEEDEFEFEFPEFDREEYMKDEIKKGKSVIACVAIAPLFSILSLSVFLFTNEWIFGFVIGILGLFTLANYLNIIRIDTSGFGRKEWLMNGAMFFFTWLAFWIILMNPPVNDFAKPTINDMEVQIYENGRWTPVDNANITSGNEYQVRVLLEITDNVEVDEDSLELRFNQQSYELQKNNSHQYYTELDLTARDNVYSVTVLMEDVNGNTNRVDKGIYIRPTD